jgi:hypothetical protein
MQPSHTHPTGRQAGLLNKWNRARGETIRVAAVKRSRSSISLPCPRSHAVCPKPRVAAPHFFPAPHAVCKPAFRCEPIAIARLQSAFRRRGAFSVSRWRWPTRCAGPRTASSAVETCPEWSAVAIELTDNRRIVGGDGSRRSCEPGSMAARLRRTMPNPSGTLWPVAAVIRQPAGRDAVRSVQTGDSAFREWRSSVLVARRSRFAH